MRMPKMDGLATIELARQLQPSAVFVMLTGNQDLATAAQAVNQGQVFRYLTKPCEMAEIKLALDAAQRQHNLITAERELTYGTFVGAIDLMSDIIEMQTGQFIDTNRMYETVKQIVEELELEIGWEERIATRIFLIGVAMLSHSERTKISTIDPSAPRHKSLVAKTCKMSAKMVERIPRLNRVSNILRLAASTEGWGTRDQKDEIAATLIRVSFYWNLLTLKGLTGAEAAKEIELVLPELNRTVSRVLPSLHDNFDAHVLMSVTASELAEGMVAHEDVISQSGEIILARGRRLTSPTIENIRRMSEFENTKFKVVATSCPEFAGAD
jgi:CheY-like chemotaxis protein